MRVFHSYGVALRTAVITAALLLCSAGDAWAAGGGGKGFYPGDLGQAIAAIAIFIVLLLILRKWAWGPIVAQLRQREDHIDQSIKQAETREEKAKQLMADCTRRLDQARDEADEVLAQARQEGEQIREKIIAEARKDAHASAVRAKEDIARARNEAMQEMRRTTADMAIDIAEQVIGKEIDAGQHHELLRESIGNVGGQAPGEA